MALAVILFCLQQDRQQHGKWAPFVRIQHFTTLAHKVSSIKET